MPRIRRYFRLSHDVNEDPTLWELTRRFGDRALRVYLELESIADRNEGRLPTMSHAFAGSLAGRCQVSRITVTKVWDYLVETSSILCDPTPRMVNYADFNKSQERNPHPDGDGKGSLPSYPLHPFHPKEPEAAPGAAVDKSKPGTKLGPELAATAGLLYDSDPRRFERMIVWIKIQQKAAYEDADIAETLRKLRAREEKHGPVDDWWAYLEGENGTGQSLIKRVRSQRLQGEAAEFNNPGSVGLKDLADLAKSAAGKRS